MADGSLEPEGFERLMGEMRPRLHRYCARMVGSAFDGEDVVQEALAKAAEAYAAAGGTIERPENWLLAIAHNTALDALRRRRRRPPTGTSLDLTRLPDARAAADARVAASASLGVLLQLPVIQRASVVLADVLGHSLDETSEILGVTVASVKAALHRARARLPALAAAEVAPAADPAERDRLRAYADRFNARDFDALRGLLAEDVRLDLVNRMKLAGRAEVAVYFGRYDESSDWRFEAALAEGRPALLVRDPGTGALAYVVLLTWRESEIAGIRDFRYASYVAESLAVSDL